MALSTQHHTLQEIWTIREIRTSCCNTSVTIWSGYTNDHQSTLRTGGKLSLCTLMWCDGSAFMSRMIVFCGLVKKLRQLTSLWIKTSAVSCIPDTTCIQPACLVPGTCWCKLWVIMGALTHCTPWTTHGFLQNKYTESQVRLHDTPP